MKLRFPLAAVAVLTLAALLPAQSTQTITLSQPAQPATVNVSLFRGSITVRAGAAGVVTVTSTPGPGQKAALPAPPAAAPPGMRLLNPGGAVSATENNNVVTIAAGLRSGPADTTVTVPASSTLNLNSMSGGITITGVTGDISAETVNGDITMNQVGGSIVAHALHGKITAAVDQLGPKPSSFSSLNGDIDLTLPADARADLRLQDDRGGIYLDNGFDFNQAANAGGNQAGPPPPPVPFNGPGGFATIVPGAKSSVPLLRQTRPLPGACIGVGCAMKLSAAGPTVAGTINGGGVELLLQDFRGNIYVHKAK